MHKVFIGCFLVFVLLNSLSKNEKLNTEISDGFISIYNRLDEIKSAIKPETEDEYLECLRQKHNNAVKIVELGNELFDLLKSNDLHLGFIPNIIQSMIGTSVLGHTTEWFDIRCASFSLACYDFHFKQVPLSYEEDAFFKICPSLNDNKAGNMFVIRSFVKKALRYLIRNQQTYSNYNISAVESWQKELIKWDPLSHPDCYAEDSIVHIDYYSYEKKNGKWHKLKNKAF